MPPLVHAYDPEQPAGRLGWVLMLLAVAVGIPLMAAFDYGELSVVQRVAALSPALLLLAGAQVAIFLHRPQGSADLLRLDAEGLTLARRGTPRRWSWSEISDLKLHGILHPAVLFLGRCISFRVPDDSRRGALAPLARLLFGGRSVVLANSYLSAPRDIAARIDAYRGQALGLAPRQAVSPDRTGRPGAAAEAPAIFHLRTKVAGQRSPARMVLLTLAGTGGAFAIFGGVWFVLNVGWTLDWAAIEDALSENSRMQTGLWAILAALLISLPDSIRRSSRRGNFLLLSSDGLHLRRNGERRHWLWHEISEFALRGTPGDPAAGGTGQAIGFVAPHDGKRPGKGADGGPLPAAISQGIEDIYDAPLREIADQIAAWRGRTTAVEPASEAGRRVSQRPAGAEAISFRRAWAPKPSVVPVLVTGLMLALMGGAVVATLWVHAAEVARNIKLLVLFAGLSFGLVVPLFLLFMMASGDSNQLRLDRDGLTYIRLGRIAGWPWRDLSSFEPRQASLRWSRKPRPLITVAIPRDDRLSRFLRWAYGIRSSQPLAVIEDIYETPLGEIARRLDEYRRRPGGARSG